MGTQNIIGFKYDNNGNRYQKYFVGMKPSKEIAETPGSLKDSTFVNDSLVVPASRPDISEEKFLAMEKGITVYPNPTKDLIMVNLNQAGKQTQANVFLYDNSGKLIDQKRYEDVQVGFDMSSSPPGNYHLKVVFDDMKVLNYTVIKVD